MNNIILSHKEATLLLKAHKEERHAMTTSLDLGRSESEAAIEPRRIVVSPDVILSVDLLEEIAEDQNTCFLIENGEIRKTQRFSDRTNLFYSLFPTDSAPALLISGIPMHRIQGTNPYLDAQSKLQTLGHISGDVLDTCTGLGYTAILAAKKATSVVTVEVDPVVLELARLNPWSKELFDDPKIQQIVGDIAEEIKRFNDNEFSYIIHDPPTISLAGELYSSAFYREMYRVLKPKGELFHYVGNSSSKSGRSTTKGVSQRLRGAGFSVVRSEERAFGLVALKST